MRTNIAVAFSCFINACLGGKRYEMLSSRAYRCEWETTITLLDTLFGVDHCKNCYLFELQKFDGIQD